MSFVQSKYDVTLSGYEPWLGCSICNFGGGVTPLRQYTVLALSRNRTDISSTGLAGCYIEITNQM